MNTKVSLEIKLEKPEAISAFADDLGSTETESNFVIVPKGGTGLNFDPGTIAILVSFFENGGIDFVRFFVDKIFNCFKREKINFIEIRIGDGIPVRILSNMSEDSVMKIVQSKLGLLNGTNQ